MYFSRTISHACVCACCAVVPRLHQFRSQRGHFVLRLFLRLQKHLVQEPLPFQFAHHFRTVFAPVFLGHPAVLCQWLSWVGLRVEKRSSCWSDSTWFRRVAMIFLFLSRSGSRSKEFGDFHFQCLCEKVNVFVRGHILLQLDVAEHIAGDAEEVSAPPPSQPAYFGSAFVDYEAGQPCVQ